MASLWEEVKTGVKQRVAESVGGFDYKLDAATVGRFLFGEEPDDRVARMQKRIYKGQLSSGVQQPWKKGDLEAGKIPPVRVAERMDLINMAAGLPQKYNTMKESEYSPTVQKDKKDGEKFYTFKDKNQMKSIYEGLKHHIPYMEVESIKRKSENTERKKKGLKPKGVMFTVGYDAGKESGKKDFSFSKKHVGMERFQVGVGEDEKGKYFSVFDPWDIDVDIPGAKAVFDKPPNIYDRIYYEDKKKPKLRRAKSETKIAKVKVKPEKRKKIRLRDRTNIDDKVFGFLKKGAGKIRDWAEQEVESDRDFDSPI